MRNRIAVWGRDAQEKRVLITIELQVADNIVRIETFPEKVVTDAVYREFMDNWRKGKASESLPEADRVIARELSVTDGLLPDDLKAEQSDMVIRAQTEWHFHVLSEKLAQTYRSEIAEIEDRIERATEYSSDLWTQAKDFWQKVQGQLQDKTLLREQGNELRKRSDAVFASLKEMRDKVNEKYKEESQIQVAKFSELLDDIDRRTEEGTHLRKVFEDLRGIQKKFHNVKFTKSDRDRIYKRIDGAFKLVKEKRGQGGDGDGGRAASALGRTEARHKGLLKALERMNHSIRRDENDLKFERRRIERTDGQLEAQIRQAKIVMIESRIASKRTKIADMEKTQQMLEQRMAKERKRVEKAARKAAERQAAEAAKAKIAAEMNQRAVSPEEAAKLEAAAAAIRAGKQPKQKKKKDQFGRRRGIPTPEEQLAANFAAFSEIVSGESAPAPAAPVGVVETAGAAVATVSAAADALTRKGGLIDRASDLLAAAGEAIGESLEDVSDTVRAVARVAGSEISEAVADARQEIAGEEE